jgi:hypothetical protein
VKLHKGSHRENKQVTMATLATARNLVELIVANPGMFNHDVSDGDAGFSECSACGYTSSGEGSHNPACPAKLVQAFALDLQADLRALMKR